MQPRHAAALAAARASKRPLGPRELALLARPEDVRAFMETRVVRQRGRTLVPGCDEPVASLSGVKSAVAQLDGFYVHLDVCAPWGTYGVANPVRSDSVREWIDAYDEDLYKSGYEPLGSGLYTVTDLWVYVRRRDAELLLLLGPDGLPPSSVTRRGVMAPLVLRRAVLAAIYDFLSAQRGGEGARLHLGHIAPSPLLWATPSAVSAGVRPPAPLDLQFGARGTKTLRSNIVGTIDVESDRDRLLEAFVARLPLLLAGYEAEGVVLTADTPVFIRSGACCFPGTPFCVDLRVDLCVDLCLPPAQVLADTA
jgi:hypothetical protein